MSDQPEKRGPRPRVFEDPNYDRYKRSKRHEDRIGAALGGRRIPRSGGRRFSEWAEGTEDGDVSTPDLKIEHKRTDKGSIRVEREWLDKVREGARMSMRDPALLLTFETPGTTKPPEDWIAVPLDVWKRRNNK